MSPVPIVDRQRALAAVGEVRIGGERVGKKVGPKLETFRLTSQQKELVERAAHQYGGTVSKWQSPVGDSWQVITERADLPIMVVVGYSLTQLYELWEGSSVCSRRCDGEVEMLGDTPCICNAEGEDKCDIITRFMMLLPELGTSLGWRFRSTGEFAASELAGGVQIAAELARGRVFVPATLRLTQRRSVGSGQVHRYVVPVLDFDPRFELGGGPPPVNGELPALPAGYKPIEIENQPASGVGVKEGLAQANRQELQRNARSAAPVGDADWEEDVVSAPVPEDPEVGTTTSVSTPEAVTEQATGSEPAPAGTVPTGTGEPALEPFLPMPDVPEPVPTPPEPAKPELINAAQVRKFHTVRRTHLVTEHRAKAILQEVTGQESSKGIPVHLFDTVLGKMVAEDTGQDTLL
jgi:hypothetical protein